jgi:hypothetical protein
LGSNECLASRIGLGETVIATDTLRRRHLGLPGRLTCSARGFTLHLPQRWLWAESFHASLVNLSAVRLVT